MMNKEEFLNKYGSIPKSTIIVELLGRGINPSPEAIDAFILGAAFGIKTATQIINEAVAEAAQGRCAVNDVIPH